MTFVVLGISGIAILKAYKYYDKMRTKNGKKTKNDLLNHLFELPEDLK